MKLPKLKTNHIYSVIWEDHFDADTSLEDPYLGVPVTAISRGLYLRETRKMIVLSYTSPGDHRTGKEETANILKHHIIGLQDLGEETVAAHPVKLPKKPRKPKKG